MAVESSQTQATTTANTTNARQDLNSASASVSAASAAQSRLAHATSLAAPLREANQSPAGSLRADQSADDDIEMDPIAPDGHRRRRSSLMSADNASAGKLKSSKSRPQSARRPANALDGPRISEEGAETDALRGGDGAADVPSDEDLHDDEETGLNSSDRRRKRRKRRRNTRLDQRVAREKITADEKKEVDRDLIRRSAINVGLIGLWYLFSLSISLYNKWMFDSNRLNFPFPLFTTAVHMLVQFSLASLTLYFVPSLRPQNARKPDFGQSRHEADPNQPIMTKMFYLTRIGPCGAATGLDIGLGNTSLKFITLTFYTMCKSSALGFVLLFAFLFRLEQPTWKLVAIIATMTFGVIMMVAGEVEFKLGGFLLVITAAFFSGFRWALTQILLLRNPATSNPFASIFFLAPVMFVTLVAIAIPVEGFGALAASLGTLADDWGVLVVPLLIVFPGTIAFCMTSSEFALLQRTSVVTLSIAGIFKEVVTLAAAALVFGDRMTAVNVLGLIITIATIAAYNWLKVTKMRSEAQVAAARRTDSAANGASSSSSNSGSGDEDEDDAGAEDARLLRHSPEADDAHVNAHGDVVTRPGSTPPVTDGQKPAREG